MTRRSFSVPSSMVVGVLCASMRRAVAMGEESEGEVEMSPEWVASMCKGSH